MLLCSHQLQSVPPGLGEADDQTTAKDFVQSSWNMKMHVVVPDLMRAGPDELYAPAAVCVRARSPAGSRWGHAP